MSLINKFIEFGVTIINQIPILQGYRTAILTTALAIIGILDTFGVSNGLYKQVAPYMLPLITVTAAAHKK